MRASVADLLCCLAMWVVPLVVIVLFGLVDSRRNGYRAGSGEQAISLRRAARVPRG